MVSARPLEAIMPSEQGGGITQMSDFSIFWQIVLPLARGVIE